MKPLPDTKTLAEKRIERIFEESKTVLFKVWNNYFKFQNQVFYSFGRSPGNTYSVGSWFNCGEEETHRLREAILAGNFEIKTKIPRISKVYRHPSSWAQKEKEV